MKLPFSKSGPDVKDTVRPYFKQAMDDPRSMESLEEEFEDFLSRREQDH